jgi:hypothetical protein
VLLAAAQPRRKKASAVRALAEDLRLGTGDFGPQRLDVGGKFRHAERLQAALGKRFGAGVRGFVVVADH